MSTNSAGTGSVFGRGNLSLSFLLSKLRKPLRSQDIPDFKVKKIFRKRGCYFLLVSAVMLLAEGKWSVACTGYESYDSAQHKLQVHA